MPGDFSGMVKKEWQQNKGMGKKKEAGKEVDFESALRELEGLTEEMEGGQMPLAELIQTYERGSHLLKYCQKALDEAREKIELIRAKGASAEDEETVEDEESDEPNDQDVRLF